MYREYFPDGTLIDQWFYDYKIPTLSEFRNIRVITDYGVKDDGQIYTEIIQEIIDELESVWGGVVVVPEGVYYSGALFFEKGVNLYVAKGGVLKGSDYVNDYPVLETRIEGQSCVYLSAFINADRVDGFTIFGEGTIDGNGARAWAAFWHRRKWNPNCTNKDEQRPRLIYISNSKNVMLCGCTFQNSQFWTTHIYKCDHVKYFNCKILSPKNLAPSTDAIDIDVCSDVLIKNCNLAVNDDAVVLKGGKGYDANIIDGNGTNERIIVEDCEYGFCHGGLTCGSESIHNRNIILRRIKIDGVARFLWFKLRPDTLQHYEYITLENIKGKMAYILYVKPWTQFYDPNGTLCGESSVHDITIKDSEFDCDDCFCVGASEKYKLSQFLLKNLKIKTVKNTFNDTIVEKLNIENVHISDK